MIISILIPTCKEFGKLTDLIREVEETSTGNYEIVWTCQKSSASDNRNIALDKASGDMIVMIDDDMTGFYKGWNEELIKPLLEDTSIMLVSARLLDKEGKPGQTSSDCFSLDPDIIDVPRTPTATIAFWNNDLRFDTKYIGSGFEDTDWAFQMEVTFDKRIVINNQVRLIHLNDMKFQRENFQKNRRVFETKWVDRLNSGNKPKWCRVNPAGLYNSYCSFYGKEQEACSKCRFYRRV